MAFKMKGFSGFKNVADTGYAGSSAFQAHKKGHAKTKEQLISEGFTPADADRMVKDGATTGVVEAKKSTTSAHGQMNDAQIEYENDKKLIAEMKRKQAALKPQGNQGDFTPAYEGADIGEKEYKKQLAKEALEKGLKPKSSLKKHVKGHVPKPKPSPKPSYKPEKVKNESLRGKMQSLLPKEQRIIEPIREEIRPMHKRVEPLPRRNNKRLITKPRPPRPRPIPPTPPPPRIEKRIKPPLRS